MTDRNDRNDLAALAHDLDAPELLDWWGSKVIWDNVGGFGVDVGGGYVFPRESAHVCEPEHFDHDETVVTVIVDRDGNQTAVSEVKAALANAEDRAEDYAGRYEASDEARADRERVQDEYLRHVSLATERADALREQVVDLNAHLEAAVSRAQRAEAERDQARADLAELEWAEMLVRQECAKGEHADWFADTEHNHSCPWCQRDYCGLMWREAEADLAAFRAEVAKVRDSLWAVRSHWGADRLTEALEGIDK